jgi:hypothetical protein
MQWQLLPEPGGGSLRRWWHGNAEAWADVNDLVQSRKLDRPGKYRLTKGILPEIVRRVLVAVVVEQIS